MGVAPSRSGVVVVWWQRSPSMEPSSSLPLDPVHDVLHYGRVALVGATEKPGSVGRTILWNLISTPFGGTVYPINPKRPNVLGIRAYPSVAAVPEKVDLAVVVTPAKTIPGIIRECVDAGVRAAV